jgi:hypothetical protein
MTTDPAKSVTPSPIPFPPFWAKESFQNGDADMQKHLFQYFAAGY